MPMTQPEVVSLDEWEAAREALGAKEQQAAEAREALAAERRRMPMVLVANEYRFEGPAGECSLVDLFEGRRQLILYRFFFDEGVEGWPEAGCEGCSMFTDGIPHLAHLHARDITYAVASPAAQDQLDRYQQRMGWDLPWYTILDDDFTRDFGVTEWFGVNVFLRDGKDVYRTYFLEGPAVESIGSVWSLLDLTPFGRQQEGEDSPDGYPQEPPYEWYRRHDEYGDHPAPSTAGRNE